MADVERRLHVLHHPRGKTVVVIEHKLDVRANADWIIDMGPEDGDAGERIVAKASTRERVRTPKQSHTSRVRADFLATRSA